MGLSVYISWESNWLRKGRINLESLTEGWEQSPSYNSALVQGKQHAAPPHYVLVQHAQHLGYLRLLPASTHLPPSLRSAVLLMGTPQRTSRKTYSLQGMTNTATKLLDKAAQIAADDFTM